MNFIRTILIFSLFILGGCFSEEEPLKVAISPWIGYESIYQAEEFGWLDKNIELVKGDSLSDSFKKIMSGEVDAATMTMEDVLIAQTEGIDLTIIAVLDISAGADVILSKGSMNTLAELKGKRVGSERSALASLMLTKTLDKAGLQAKDVSVVNLSPIQQLEAWNNDKIDVAITYEPYATKLLREGANYVISSKEFPEMIFDVLAVRTDRIKDHELGLKTLLQSHFKTLEYFRKNYIDTLHRVAAREGNTPDDVKRAFGGVVLPSKAANKVFMSNDSNLYRSAQGLNTLMFEKGFILKKADLNDFTSVKFIND